VCYTAAHGNKETNKISHLNPQEVGLFFTNFATNKNGGVESIQVSSEIKGGKEKRRRNEAAQAAGRAHPASFSDGIRSQSARRISPVITTLVFIDRHTMAYFTYDTSVIISRKISDLRVMPQNFLMSVVVLLELTGNAADVSMRKAYEQVFHQYRRDKLLIVPNDDDWLLASKFYFYLTNARRRERKGKLPRLPVGASIRASQFFSN